jgi:hypothetical protein
VIGDGSAVEILTNPQLLDQASLVMPQIAMLMNELKDLTVPPAIIDAYSAREFLKNKLRQLIAARPPKER